MIDIPMWLLILLIATNLLVWLVALFIVFGAIVFVKAIKKSIKKRAGLTALFFCLDKIHSPARFVS